VKAVQGAIPASPFLAFGSSCNIEKSAQFFSYLAFILGNLLLLVRLAPYGGVREVELAEMTMQRCEMALEAGNRYRRLL